MGNDGDTATSNTAELALIDASHNQLESLERAAYSTPGTVLLPVSGRVDADFETDHVDVWVKVKDAGNTILAEGPATLGAFAVSNPAAERQAAGWDALLEFDAPAADALLTVEVVTTARLAPAEPGYTAVETRQVAYDADWGVAYEYDGRLNLAARTSGDTGGTVARAEYAYDAMDRLVAADLPSGLRHEYVYDAMTRRLATRSGDGASTATAVHFYGPGWETLADLDADLAPRRVYVTAGGMDAQVAMLSPDGAGGWTTHYYLRDHLGSVLALVDATGAVAESYEYAPYGQPTILSIDGAGMRTVASSPSGNRFLYTGREWEPEAGYYHYRHRTYHPTDRRFMQADPIGLGGGWNHYAYVGGNPVMASDPMGLKQIKIPATDGEFIIEVDDGMPKLWQERLYDVFMSWQVLREKYKGVTRHCAGGEYTPYKRTKFNFDEKLSSEGQTKLSGSTPMVYFRANAYTLGDEWIPPKPSEGDYSLISDDKWRSYFERLWFASVIYHEMIHVDQIACRSMTEQQAASKKSEDEAYLSQWQAVLYPGFAQYKIYSRPWLDWIKAKLKVDSNAGNKE